MKTFYTSEKVNERITAIRSLTGEIMYLIEGKDRAALIDTCLGVGHLRRFVETLTDKPLTVWLTHGHVDHAMGAPEFDRVSMNPADDGIYREMADLAVRKGYIAANGGGGDWQDGDFVPPFPFEYEALTDGTVLNLGGLHLEAISLPGHTPGTMAVLVEEEGILILGDACNTFTFLFDENALTVEAYRRNLAQAAIRLKGRYRRVFLCHHDIEAGAGILDNVIGICDDILAGRADDMPFDFMGGTYFLAKAIHSPADIRRLDGGEGNVIYNKEKVRVLS